MHISNYHTASPEYLTSWLIFKIGRQQKSGNGMNIGMQLTNVVHRDFLLLCAKVLFANTMKLAYHQHLCLLIDGVAILLFPFTENSAAKARKKVSLFLKYSLFVASQLDCWISKSLSTRALPNQWAYDWYTFVSLLFSIGSSYWAFMLCLWVLLWWVAEIKDYRRSPLSNLHALYDR